MDEEEKRRQAASAAFAQAAAEEPQFAAPRSAAEQNDEQIVNEVLFSKDADNGKYDNMSFGAAYQKAGVDNGLLPAQASPFGQGGGSSVPGASEAFAQLDQAPNADPTQFDDRMADGTQEGVGEVLRQSFDENLRAARDAVAGQVRRASGATGATGGSDGEIAQYRDRLLKMADQMLAGGGEQQRQPQDPYAAQREREALVAKRLGTFDLFSDSRTTRTPISAQTVQTDAYDKVLMGKDNKDLFDSFL